MFGLGWEIIRGGGFFFFSFFLSLHGDAAEV